MVSNNCLWVSREDKKDDELAEDRVEHSARLKEFKEITICPQQSEKKASSLAQGLLKA